MYHDFAFFPIWPALIAVASLGGRLPAELVGAILANVLFVLAAVAVFASLSRINGPTFARNGLLLLAFSPGAFVFSLPYAESLFLLLAALFFLSSASTSWLTAFMGQLTRLTGFGLTAAGLAELLRPETRTRGARTVAAGLAAFGLWWLFIAWLTGNPAGYMEGSPSWYAATGPNETTTFGLASVVGSPFLLGYVSAGFAIAVLASGVVLVRRRELPMGFYSVAVAASGIILGTWTTMPRLTMLAYPALAILVNSLASTRARFMLVAVIAALQAAWVLLAIFGIVTP